MQRQSQLKEYMNFDHIYQIWYNEKTKKQVFHGFQPICNARLTPFFENSVIASLLFESIPARSWVGVLSPEFFRKVSVRLAGGINGEKIDKFLNDTDKDVVSFFPQLTQRNIITQAENYHTGYVKLFNHIIKEAGIDYDIRRRARLLMTTHTGHPVYTNIVSNHVIARKEVYQRYVNEVLIPCMEVMGGLDGEMKDLLWSDAKYKQGKASPNHLLESYGKPYYTYHTFICERFWTLFMNMNTTITMSQYPFI